MNPNAAQYTLTYVISPILLTGGIAATLAGGTMPIIQVTDALQFPSASQGGSSGFDLDGAFAHYHPMPGSSLENYDYGKYPFANQVTAANAAITEPLMISMMMTNPRRHGGDYNNFGPIMQALKATIDQHILAGGTFTVVTPAYPYTNALLKRLFDASSSDSKQGQWRWQWDFEVPLVSLQQAAQVAQNQNNLMSQMSSGQQITPDTNGNVNWSGSANTTGNPGSTAAPTTVPSSQSSPVLGSGPGGGNYQDTGATVI